MRQPPALTVLFVAAAGPRLGFGHLVRSGVLATAMGVRPHIVLRARAVTRRAARAMGWTVHRAIPTILRSLAPQLVVVDDPALAHAKRWIRAATERGVPVVAIRDLGLPFANADLTIDGSLARTRKSSVADLDGPSYAILDETVTRLRQGARVRDPRRVLIALGGGTHVRSIGVEVARRIRDLSPGVTIDLAPGSSASPLPALPAGCRWIDRQSIRHALATAGVAVVGGGVTLYEGCALGAPMVALAVVERQRVTTRAAAARGAAIDTRGDVRRQTVEAAAGAVADLLASPRRRSELGVRAARLVDGQGTTRVVAHIRALVMASPTRGTRHAA